MVGWSHISDSHFTSRCLKVRWWLWGYTFTLIFASLFLDETNVVAFLTLLFCSNMGLKLGSQIKPESHKKDSCISKLQPTNYSPLCKKMAPPLFCKQPESHKCELRTFPKKSHFRFFVINFINIRKFLHYQCQSHFSFCNVSVPRRDLTCNKNIRAGQFSLTCPLNLSESFQKQAQIQFFSEKWEISYQGGKLI